MHWVRRKGDIPLSMIILLSTARANPIIQFPINSQIPPVALTSQPYAFTFAESTFISTNSPITYTLFDEPAWLKLDSGSHAFSGSPSWSDIGPATFQLIATDAQGSTSLSVTLIVVQDGGLEVGQSVLAQLAGFGLPVTPTSLILYPLQSFTFEFSPDTFHRTSSSTIYYATSGDNSPLPSWLEFDASILCFVGATPPLVSPTSTPQAYKVRLVASDIPGFAEAIAEFQIVISYHVLAFSVGNEKVNATIGKKVETAPLRETLSLDGKAVQDSELVMVSTDAPSWLVLDHENISLSGIPPSDAMAMSVSISVMDVHGDVANATTHFSFSGNSTPLFLGDEPVANATIGQDFNYTISRSLLAPGNITVAADLGSASAWLVFDPSDLSFNGKVPLRLAPSPINVQLFAKLEHETETENLRINVIGRSATTSESNISPVSTSTRSSSNTPTSSISSTERYHSSLSRSTRLKIVLAVVLPLVLSILLVTLLIFYRQRKPRLPANQMADVPSPLPATPTEERIQPELVDAGTVRSVHNEAIRRPHTTPTEPPRIELSWAPDSFHKAKTRLSTGVSSREDSFLNLNFTSDVPQDSKSPTCSSRGELNAPRHFTAASRDITPFISTTASNYTGKRTPLRPVQAKTGEEAALNRASKAFSAMSSASFSSPTRLSGAGHGAGGKGPPGSTHIRSSWQDTESPYPSMDSRATALDIVEEFPQPPLESAGSRNLRSPQRNGKASMRLVATSSSQTGSPADDRKRWYSERARDSVERGSRFFHSWSSRPHSGGRRLEAANSTFGRDNSLTPHIGRHGQWSQDRGLVTSIQPEVKSPGRSSGRPCLKPPSKIMRDRSTASSDQFDSALSTPSSQWEDEILTTEVDSQDEGTHHPAENARKEGQRVPLQDAAPTRSATVATGLSEASSAGSLDMSPASRKIRLGNVPGKRPASVGEGKVPKSQRSHQGSLAFI
jgi:axial budding pattern protein 2